MRFPFQLAKDKEFDAVGFGLNAVDHLIVVPEYPQFDTKSRLIEHRQSSGGQTASAMVGLQRLGLKSAYAGRFGSDPEGEFGLRSLQDEGVDTRFCETIPNSRTQIAFILIDARTGERTIIWDRDERLAYPSEEAPTELATMGAVLHIDAHDPPACVVMAEQAHSGGTLVSGDFDNVYPGVEKLLPHMDLLVSSKEFPKRLTGIADERAALSTLRERYGYKLVGMTLGDRGAVIYAGDTVIESPAFPVPGGCRDTTGAGDAFHSGLLYGLITGLEIEESLRAANATAALKCRQLGARSALPSREELAEFIGAKPEL